MLTALMAGLAYKPAWPEWSPGIWVTNHLATDVFATQHLGDMGWTFCRHAFDVWVTPFEHQLTTCTYTAVHKKL